MRKFLPGFLIFFLGFTLTSAAQNSCSQNLITARQVYQEGKLQELPGLLESCIKNGFSKDERVEAYRLLILSYLFSEEQKKAEKTMLTLLRVNPEYQVNPEVDPVELINLYNKFKTDPAFLWGVNAAGNYNLIRPTALYGSNNVEEQKGKYSKTFGFQAGITATIFLTDPWSLHPELNYKSTSFTLTKTLSTSTSQTKKQVSTETQQWIQLPVAVHYRLLGDKQRFVYADGGVAIDYLLSSKLSTSGTSLGNEVARNNVDISNMRRSINGVVFLGIGGQMKQGRNYLSAFVRFYYGILNQVIADNRYSNPDLYIGAGYVDNDYLVHYISAGIAFQIPKYNPKKIK